MGFLKLERDAAINLNKAIFSCFVYIPSSLATAVASRDGGDLAGETYIMDHAVSLITFGAQQASVEYDHFNGTIGTCDPGVVAEPTDPVPVPGGFVIGSHAVAVQPSCIGVAFLPWMSTTPTLYVNIQTANGPVTVGWQFGSGSFTCNYNEAGAFTGYDVEATDDSYINNLPHYAALGNAKTTLLNPAFGRPTLILDAWNHIILSWQLFNEASAATEDGKASLGVSATSRMYCSVNDVNMSGYDLPASWPGQNDDSGYDPNACCSDMTWWLGDDTSNPAPVNPDDLYTPTMTLDYGTIPTNPIWIPGPPTLVCNDVNRGTSMVPNLGIIMSHLQLLNGVILDTSIEANRRLFLAADGKPADPKAAQNALGKKPAVQFIKSKDWIDGKNKGSAGNFTKTGTVAVHTPGPGA